jgi:hypothetical protein
MLDEDGKFYENIDFFWDAAADNNCITTGN